MRSLFFSAAMLFLVSVALRSPFVGVLAWNWIAFMNPQQISYGFGSSAPWALISAVATVAGCIASREPKRFPTGATTILIILFVIGISVTTLTALAPSFVTYESWLRTVKVFGFLLVTISLLTSRERITALIWMLAISFGFFAVYQGGAVLVSGGGHHVEGPPASMIGDNNEFGAAMLVVLPLFNFLRLQSRERLTRIALGFVLLMGVVTVLGTYSRGAFLGMAAVGAIFWARSRAKIGTGMLILLLVAGGAWFLPETWMARMDTIQHYQGDGSVASRFEVWAEAWRVFLAHPLTGGGFRVTGYAPLVQQFAPGFYPLEIHSIWFQVLGEQGAIVGAIWLAFTLVGIRNTFWLARQARRVPELAWCGDLARMIQCSIVAYCVSGTFLPIAYWDTYFTVLVCLAAACELAKAELRQVLRPPAGTRAGRLSAPRQGHPGGATAGAGSAWAARKA